jgi:hypothetical protein
MQNALESLRFRGLHMEWKSLPMADFGLLRSIFGLRGGGGGGGVAGGP